MPSNNSPVLVVGATGNLGGQVVDELLARGKNVRALVRPGSGASRLEAKGVEIARGDMLDLDSLVRAMTGADAVITTAAGYTRANKNAHDIDTVGNANLAQAASQSGIRRFVLTSILTSDQTPEVTHFWHKKLAEDKLEELGVPFVALRPGAFLDQVTQMGGDPFEKKRLIWLGDKTVPLTFVLTSDLAGHLAAAVDAPGVDGQRIDVGWDRPVSMQDVADIASRHLGERIKVRAVPTRLIHTVGVLLGRFVPVLRDMGPWSTGSTQATTSPTPPAKARSSAPCRPPRTPSPASRAVSDTPRERRKCTERRGVRWWRAALHDGRVAAASTNCRRDGPRSSSARQGDAPGLARW